MKFILFSPRFGYLADFDPEGKPDYAWSENIHDAWVFKSIRQTKTATRWIRQRVIVKGIIYKGRRRIALKLAGGSE